jgi:hypothetical protein
MWAQQLPDISNLTPHNPSPPSLAVFSAFELTSQGDSTTSLTPALTILRYSSTDELSRLSRRPTWQQQQQQQDMRGGHAAQRVVESAYKSCAHGCECYCICWRDATGADGGVTEV